MENTSTLEPTNIAISKADEVLTSVKQISSYHVAELVTLASDGSPVCWPLVPELDHGVIRCSTQYLRPTKALNARRNPNVAMFFSDPTASGRSDADPVVLIQGQAKVVDPNLQADTEKYIDQLTRLGPWLTSLMFRVPMVRRSLASFLVRIWIEITPQREYIWPRGGMPPADLIATRPGTFSPGLPIQLTDTTLEWTKRYKRPPVLSFVDAQGRPGAMRAEAEVGADSIRISSGVAATEAAPACLTYHRLSDNRMSTDAFLIRGHFDRTGKLIPERVVGMLGTEDDRGSGSRKMGRVTREMNIELDALLAKRGLTRPIFRPSPK